MNGDTRQEAGRTLRDLVDSSVPYIYIVGIDVGNTFEEIREELSGISPERAWARWNCADGLQVRVDGKWAAAQVDTESNSFLPGPSSPLQAIRWLAGNAPKSHTFLVIENAQFWFSETRNRQPQMELWQALQNLRYKLGALSSTVIFIASDPDLPREVSRLFSILDWPLPGKDEIQAEIAWFIQSGKADPENTESANALEITDDLLSACLGMTRWEVLNAVAASFTRHGRFEVGEIRRRKEQFVREASALEIQHPKDGFSSIMGYENAKTFVGKIIQSPLSRGVLALGFPGCGKTMFGTALAAECGWPFLSFDMGRLYNRLQGESERALRSVIKTADAFGRCVLFLDEIDKMAGGAHSSAQTDGGTTLRLIGRLLSWMSDRPDNGPFIFATCNDYSSLAAISDGALVRAGRWDGTLFFDLPTAREAVQILGYYAKQYDLDMNQRIPDLAEWSGAEIKQLCRISKMMNLPLVEAMDYVTIQAKVHGKRFQELREWARTRCVQASLDESPQVKQSKKKLALAVDRQ